MYKKFLVTILLSLFTATQAQAIDGRLLIVGGALAEKNDEIYNAFIEGLTTDDKIAIIPAASGKPIRSSLSFAKSLMQYGVKADQIDVVHLAMRDDSSTDVDESKWSKGAFDEQQISAVRNAKAIWFVGGDQSRITALLKPDGKPTPMLAVLHERLTNGAIIGGTSAGAAMMSEHMIAAGDSMSAFYSAQAQASYGDETVDAGPLLMAKGIGFFTHGIIDQHFDKRARLARLVKASQISNTRFGIGISENTGILVNLEDKTIKALGSSYIAITDSKRAKANNDNIINIKLHLLSNTDVFSFQSNRLTTQGIPTIGNEYSSYKDGIGSGISFANQSLADTLGADLLDNAGIKTLTRYGIGNDGSGLRFRFAQNNSSQGFYRADTLYGTRYSVFNVRLDIEKVQVDIIPSR